MRERVQTVGNLPGFPADRLKAQQMSGQNKAAWDLKIRPASQSSSVSNTIHKEGNMAPKIRLVLASHGKLSEGMLNTVQMLLGPQENIAAYCLMPEQDVDAFSAKLAEEIRTYGAENIVFLTELLHGSPFNCTVSLTRDYDLYHVSGINLAMLMGAVLERDDEDATPQTVCEAALAAAEGSYQDVRKLLAVSDEEEDDE